MSRRSVDDVSEVLLATSLPIESGEIEVAAESIINFYALAPAPVSLPSEEVADRFSELWHLWFESREGPKGELKSLVKMAISVDHNMEGLASRFFKVESKLEKKCFMSRSYAIALIGSAGLIRSLVVEQRLGLDRIRSIINVPGATFDAIKIVLSAIGVQSSFDTDGIVEIHSVDEDDVATYFGDTLPDDADAVFLGLLGSFSRSNELWEDVTELVHIGFEPYLFFLYYELLTLEKTDRFPGKAIYECAPRGQAVKALWNDMYKPDQENPYLNNAKSVYSLDETWAETKLSRDTQNGSLLLAGAFEIMSELPYSNRRNVAHLIRCYLVLMSSRNRASSPLRPAGHSEINAFVGSVSKANSLTRGVLDQRLVDFLAVCSHDDDSWSVRGLGSSVNESNTSARKYGDIEFTNVDGQTIQAFEAHGGGLRDEYIEDHARSLHATAAYYKSDARERGTEYDWKVEVIYVAHDVSRVSMYYNGYQTIIEEVPFTFRFLSFEDLVSEAGGLEGVCERADLFEATVHNRISRLPDAYSLKQRYCEIVGM